MTEKAPRLLIAYELSDPTHTELSRKNITDALKSLGAKREITNVWTVQTDLDENSMLRKLGGYFTSQDHLFIAKVGMSVNRNRTVVP